MKRILIWLNMNVFAPFSNYIYEITRDKSHDGKGDETIFLVDPHPYSVPTVPEMSDVVDDGRFCVACKHSLTSTKGNDNDEEIEFVLCVKFANMVSRSVVTAHHHAPYAEVMRADERMCGVEGRFFEPNKPRKKGDKANEPTRLN